MGALDKQKTGSGGGTIDADVMEFKGGWAANTNTPTLSNSDTDVNGNTYKVTTAGSTDFGAGAISFSIGDLVINNGSTWEKFDSTYTDAEIKAAVDNELTGSTVGTTDAQTLTNKSIDADNNTITNIDNNEIKASAGISFSKLETVGTDHIVGRTSAGSGVVTGLTATQVRAILNVENGATADQTGAEIKSLYEAESNTNAFTDSEKSKLSGIETGAEVNDVNSVNGQTGTVSLDADDIDDTSTIHKFTTSSDITKLSNIEDNATANPNAFDKTTETLDDITAGTTNKHFTASDESKLDGIESNATADMTDGEIKTAYENNANTNAFTDAEQTKLAGIEAGAEVNDVTSVNSQTGAVSLDADDIDDTSTTHKFATSSQLSKLDGVEAGATADQSDAEIETAYNNQVDIVTQAEAEAGTDTNVHRWTPERVKQAIDALAGGGGGATTYSLSEVANVSTTATSRVDVTGTTLDIPAGKKYKMFVNGEFSTNSSYESGKASYLYLEFSGYSGSDPAYKLSRLHMGDGNDITTEFYENTGLYLANLVNLSDRAYSNTESVFYADMYLDTTSTIGTITLKLTHTTNGTGTQQSYVGSYTIFLTEITG